MKPTFMQLKGKVEGNVLDHIGEANTQEQLVSLL